MMCLLFVPASEFWSVDLLFRPMVHRESLQDLPPAWLTRYNPVSVLNDFRHFCVLWKIRSGHQNIDTQQIINSQTESM